MLYYLINRYKLDRELIFELGLKVTLDIPYSLTKKAEHFGFIKREIVIINIEFSLYLDPLIL